MHSRSADFCEISMLGLSVLPACCTYCTRTGSSIACMVYTGMGSVSRSLSWELRLSSTRSARFRVQYQSLDLTNDATGSTALLPVNAVQLAAYCEAVKRLTAQGVEEPQAVQVLKQCGGDLDAAEVWIGVCTSVGLCNLCDPSDTSESWMWEGRSGHLHFASSLQEVVKSMQGLDGKGEFSAVASLIESTASAVTADMQQEVTQLELARKDTEQSHADELSVQDILARWEASSGISRSRIVAIEEVVNPPLWDLYNKQKALMPEPNERWLFHGSGPESVAHISVEGFDLKLANPSGSYGAGVYFAASSSTSTTYTTKGALKAMAGLPVKCQQQSDLLVSARSKGLQVMLLCTVLLGRVGNGQAGQRQAPAGYDSVGGSAMNVIYKSEQAYPRYMVFFK